MAARKTYLDTKRNEGDGLFEDDEKISYAHIPHFQVQLYSEENPKTIRQLQSNNIGELVSVSGIITSASKS